WAVVPHPECVTGKTPQQERPLKFTRSLAFLSRREEERAPGIVESELLTPLVHPGDPTIAENSAAKHPIELIGSVSDRSPDDDPRFNRELATVGEGRQVVLHDGYARTVALDHS
ncbi:MAG: hypothetical protein KDK70_38610, partial [Myxococcales bacterium]|nr:hypothetical protein [Myxococcales bacterium]